MERFARVVSDKKRENTIDELKPYAIFLISEFMLILLTILMLKGVTMLIEFLFEQSVTFVVVLENVSQFAIITMFAVHAIIEIAVLIRKGYKRITEQ